MRFLSHDNLLFVIVAAIIAAAGLLVYFQRPRARRPRAPRPESMNRRDFDAGQK